MKEADDKYMILAKVVGRRDILNNEGLTEDLLKPYRYFVKHHTLSRRNFVIPMLEQVLTIYFYFIFFTFRQWIPGCEPTSFYSSRIHNIYTVW